MLFGCDPKTIRRGLAELNSGLGKNNGRDRKKGGGRKLSIKRIPGIHEAFEAVVRDYTAGDPMDERIRWTHLTHQQIADKLMEMGITVSRKIVRQLFKKHGYVKRKAQKSLSTGTCKYRDAQFSIISDLISQYKSAGNPVISIDTKKKEKLGNLYRDGQLYTLSVQKVLDHDFPHLACGLIVPHGIYDVVKNRAYVNIGTSKDTSEFACDSFRAWWYNQGRYEYARASSILVLCDAGGSNSYRHHIFKSDLQQLADEIGVEIRIAHYPPYTSKWNPIEHRLFCHITRSLKGVILKTYEQVKELVERTTTKTGLTVKANIIKKEYEAGRQIAVDFKETMRIVFDQEFDKEWGNKFKKELSQLNYRAIPLKI